MALRVGTGFDIHALESGRKLVLGGLHVPFDRGPRAHSDGDVLIHAIIDALLGAAGLGDIGQHFPDTDARWAGAAGRDLLGRCARILREAGYRVVNVDASIFLESPKLGERKGKMAAQIAETLDLDAARVNVKAGTLEGLGPIGRSEAVAAQAIALVEESSSES